MSSNRANGGHSTSSSQTTAGSGSAGAVNSNVGYNKSTTASLTSTTTSATTTLESQFQSTSLSTSTSLSQEEEEEDDEDDQFEEASENISPPTPPTPTPSTSSTPSSLPPPSPLALHAAKLASISMESDCSHYLRAPASNSTKPNANSSKKITSLKHEDVALTEEQMELDLIPIRKALHLFLNSRVIESESICSSSPHALYFSIGFSFIQVIKSLATFQPSDLLSAISSCTDTLHVANLLRKKDWSWVEKVKMGVTGSVSVECVARMSKVEREAELVGAEARLLGSTVGILYSGDIFAFIKEALHLRNAYSTYRTLAKYIEEADELYTSTLTPTSPSGPTTSSTKTKSKISETTEDPNINNNFRSGVLLGNGMISLMLSLLPSSVLGVMSVFGFTGDRQYALNTLMKVGGWSVDSVDPSVPVEEEGIRRPMADMILLTYNLVFSTYLPISPISIPLARSIVSYNLTRYPKSIFFLYFSGRLLATLTKLHPAIPGEDGAIEAFEKAIQSQIEYKSLGHIAIWDLGLCGLALGDWNFAEEKFKILGLESGWSKSIYWYAEAVTKFESINQSSGVSNEEKALELQVVKEKMKQVPISAQKIGGKSIPLEKFVSRRSKKYLSQSNRLLLPGLELAYFFNCLNLSPRKKLISVHLNQVLNVLESMGSIEDRIKFENKGGEIGGEWWDDFCLAHLLQAVLLRLISHPESFITPDPLISPIPIEESNEIAFESLSLILKHANRVLEDGFLIWFTHYELGKYYEAIQEFEKAKLEYQIVLSGKIPELLNTSRKTKGKVSLQNMVVLRSNAALMNLVESGR